MIYSNQKSKCNKGSASKLIGNCCIVNIYVEFYNSFWPNKERLDVAKRLEDATRFIITRAREYNIEYLKIEQREENFYFEIPEWIETEAPKDNEWIEDIVSPYSSKINKWTEDSFKQKVYKSGNGIVDYIKNKFNADQVAILFHINKNAPSINSTYYNGIDERFKAERAVMFYKYGDGRPTAAASYVHEILHLFGAGDLYFPIERKNMAEIYFPNDIMYRTDYKINNLTINEFTAYRIGWCRDLRTEYEIFEDPG